tara:strand:+ start:32189 stop:33760 length:1572 start_codon:yes stop_codon:yes gene_type:complete
MEPPPTPAEAPAAYQAEEAYAQPAVAAAPPSSPGAMAPPPSPSAAVAPPPSPAPPEVAEQPPATAVVEAPPATPAPVPEAPPTDSAPPAADPDVAQTSVEEVGAPAEVPAKEQPPANMDLINRERDPNGGVTLRDEEDISLRFPAGLLLTSEGIEPDMSIEDEDLRLFDMVLQDAVNEDVADLHIKEDTYIHFRMSRGLRDRDFPMPTRKWIEKVIFSMCPEHFVEDFKKDREVDFSYFNPKFGRFRVNVFSQCSKWAMAMRYIKNDLPPIEKLGINPICLKLSEAKRGLTLLAGITGSGKSTTMAAMVMHLNKNFRKHIVTIEDPVEMMFDDDQCVIEQREVGLDTMTFQRALKSALRQDPDMVLVGEMRDATSIGAAMRAADTGAMVLSTVHTRTAASVPGRLLDFFPEEEREMQRKKYSEVIVGAVAQRMCPTLDGGMVPAQEIMIGTPLIKQKIFDGELNKLPACIDVSEDDGMLSFNKCMYNLVNDGRISKEIAMDNCTNPQQLEMWFQGIEISSGIV